MGIPHPNYTVRYVLTHHFHFHFSFKIRQRKIRTRIRNFKNSIVFYYGTHPFYNFTSISELMIELLESVEVTKQDPNDSKGNIIDENVLKRLNSMDEELFIPFPPQVSITLSNRFRSLAPDPNVTFCYTEVLSKSFIEFITNLKNFDIGFNESSIFVDVGSGIGKTILLLTIMNTFKRAVGIEINDSLHKKGMELIKGFNKRFRTPIDQTEMELIRGDGTYIDWSYANLVYIQCACFNDEMLSRISTVANKLFPGSIIITIARRLTDESFFDLVGISRIEYIHGSMPAYIYRKSSKAPSNHPDSLYSKLLDVLNRKLV